MNNIIKNNVIVSKEFKSCSIYTGIGSYWTWTANSMRVAPNFYPAEKSSRVFSILEEKMKQKNNWLIFSLMVLYLTFFGFISISYAQESKEGMGGSKEEKEEEIITENKTIEGVVGGIGGKYIGIVYKKSEGIEYELAIAVSEKVDLVRVKSFKSIAPGDTVSVDYIESTQEYEEVQADGSVETKTKVLSRVATKISLLRPASDSLRSEG